MIRRLLPLLLTLLLLSCDFRDPNDGFDGNWEPDHGGDDARGSEGDDGIGEDIEFDDDLSEEGISRQRPRQILADTGTMTKVEGEWSMEEVGSTTFTAYLDEGKTAMIVERTTTTVRNYFFTEGRLFYYNETATDGSFDLTVEFDELGDVRGAQKLENGESVGADLEDYTSIVEHTMELIQVVEKR